MQASHQLECNPVRINYRYHAGYCLNQVYYYIFMSSPFLINLKQPDKRVLGFNIYSFQFLTTLEHAPTSFWRSAGCFPFRIVNHNDVILTVGKIAYCLPTRNPRTPWRLEMP